MIPETQKFKQLKYLEFDDKNSIGETIRKVSIRVRGGGSISQSNDPLVLIDWRKRFIE